MKIPIKINSIFEGQAPSQYFGSDGTFISSISIDPDFSISTGATDIKTSGFVVPIGSAVFSTGAVVNTSVVALITNPKDTKTYAVTSGGKLISYDSAFGTETAIGTVAGSNAQGATYYNNYIYIFGTGASKDDVSRYGPLNNSPVLTDGVWKGATLGSQTALTNTTYPTLRSVSIPNHWGHVHGDNSLYFCDFINGQGRIHRINTKKVTNEGDTNGTTVPSAYGALVLPFGFYPTCLASYSTSLFIGGIYTTDTTINQGKAAFILWDATSTNFYLGPVFLPDAYCTAALNANGIVYLWTGNAVNGVRLSQYLYGERVKELALQEEGMPPFAGAVDATGNRIAWGGFTTNPNANACVYAYGSKDERLPPGLHNIMKLSSSGTTPITTAIKYVQQSSYIRPKIIAGWNDGSGSGIDQYSSSATLAANIRWMFNIGERFDIQRIRIPLAGAVDSNTTITPTLYFDDLSTTNTSMSVINNTNWPSKRRAIYKNANLVNANGLNNFVLELAWTGTNPLPVALPISIDVETRADETP